MKRLTGILLATLLLLSLCGCNANRQRINKPADFYYCHNTALPTYTLSDGVIAPEQRESDGYDDLAKLLSLYLRGPQDPQLRSPFPREVTVVQLLQNGTAVEITLSAQFAGLSGYDLTLACTCLAMTVMELTQAETVQISAEESLLGGNPVISISKDQLVFEDASAAEATE